MVSFRSGGRAPWMQRKPSLVISIFINDEAAASAVVVVDEGAAAEAFDDDDDDDATVADAEVDVACVSTLCIDVAKATGNVEIFASLSFPSLPPP